MLQNMKHMWLSFVKYISMVGQGPLNAVAIMLPSMDQMLDLNIFQSTSETPSSESITEIPIPQPLAPVAPPGKAAQSKPATRIPRIHRSFAPVISDRSTQIHIILPSSLSTYGKPKQKTETGKSRPIGMFFLKYYCSTLSFIVYMICILET